MSTEIARRQFDGLAIGRRRLVEALHGGQHVAQIVVGVRIARVQFERLADQLDGAVVFMPLRGEHPQKMQGVDLPRIPAQYLAIKRFRRIELPLPVQGNRLLDPLCFVGGSIRPRRAAERPTLLAIHRRRPECPVEQSGDATKTVGCGRFFSSSAAIANPR